MNDNESQSQPPDLAAAPAAATQAPQSSLTGLLKLWTLRRGIPNFSPTNFILITLSVLWLLLWAAIDWWEALPDPEFLIAGIPLFPWYAVAILALAALLRGQSNPKPAFAQALLLSLGLVPLPLLLAALAVPFLSLGWRIAAIAVLIYSSFYLTRGLRAFTGGSQRRAVFAGVAFLMAFLWLTDALDAIPDVWAAPEVA